MATDARVKIATSILSADLSRLGEQVAEASRGGADYIHVDIMDGHFVPALTFGPMTVRAIREWTDTPLDVHMMVSEPGLFISDMAEAGAHIITVHAEAHPHLHRLVRQIQDAGVRAGVALNPSTPVSAVEEIIADVDLVLVMTVNPGFGGQAFISSMIDKIARVRAALDARGLSAELEVDGGISPATAGKVVEAGAGVLVAGSAVYGSEAGIAEAISRVRKSAESGL